MKQRCLVNRSTDRAVRQGTRKYRVIRKQKPLQRNCSISPVSKRAFRLGTRLHRNLWKKDYPVPPWKAIRNPKPKRKSKSKSPVPQRRSKSPLPIASPSYKPGRIDRIPGRPLETRLRSKRLPAVELRNSYIPGAGLGLFASEDLPKGALITEYGGRVVDREESRALAREGKDTHLRSIAKGHEALDGRVVPPTFTRDYYVKNHLLGSFANQAPTKATQNTIYVNELGPGYVHPYGGIASDRVFLKAIRPIGKGEEVYVNYGRRYAERHLGPRYAERHLGRRYAERHLTKPT
jgi:hypothetical protein